MSGRPSTVERAFELARSGACANLKEIRSRLSREGYLDANVQISGPALARQLGELIQTARHGAQAFEESSKA
jgi:hypothetical protein